MFFRFAPLAALSVAISANYAHAQAPSSGRPVESGSAPPSVVITGNPLGSGLFDLVAPVTTMEGNELRLRAQSSLGETLGHLPGVTSTYFGPAASRPIIRGMDGDRIRILQNSVGTLDASGLSFDHGVPIEPLSVDRIEVVRGPAALFYGGSAVGGVVNVMTNRIPERPVAGLQGSVDTRLGGADSERGLGSMVEAGNGRFALHAEGFWRQSSDLKIPGFARSARQRATDAANDLANGTTTEQPRGEVPNTPSRTDGGAIGGAFTWNTGYAGMSYTNHSIIYGSPAERNIRIDMHSDRYDLAGEVRELTGFIASLKFKGGYTDYVHREINGGVVGTNFLNKGYEGRIEATHAALGPVKGAFGLQVGKNRFSALGDEAFIPPTLTDTFAMYVFEEMAVGAGKINFGGRIERTGVNANASLDLLDASTGLSRFPSEQSRRFNARSLSFGGLLPVGPVTFTANLSHTERAPTYSELFAYGPHAATGTYELGTSTFGVEKSNGIDAGVKWKTGPHSGSVSAYQNKFDNYITGFTTGVGRDADGTINAAGDFREFVFRQNPARFRGLEAEARFRLLERPGTLYLELKADTVRADNLATGEALPRIPAARFGAALNFARDAWNIKFEATRSAAQTRVPAADTPTDGYTLVNLYGNLRFTVGPTRMSAWIKATNLTNVEARLATSILRERVPLGGRAVAAGLRVDF